MVNSRCSRENNILQHWTFNSTLKQATFIDNQREYCLYYPWVQCYQWHLLHPVFSVCYFSSEFSILSNVSFETPCIFQIIYIIQIFTIFQKMTKMFCLLWGNIHLHTITSLQYLPKDVRVRHFAFNAAGEAGKKMVEFSGIWLYLTIEVAGSHWKIMETLLRRLILFALPYAVHNRR